MSGRADTLVFVPAWNEEENLPAVLAELRSVLPEADVLVVDDGSTDGTADVARAAGAEVLSFGENRGLPVGVAAGYAYAREHGYRWCGRVDADGQHPAEELKRLLERVRSGACDVAVGSRFATGDGYDAYRYRGPRERELGQWLLRRLMQRALGRPMLDATSGLYAVGERALPILAEPYEAGAPEVEGLIRLSRAGLRVEEVPAHMRERAGGESKLAGKKALMLVLTVGATVLLARRRR
ncbi:MAG TPA: glycosyltransferase family 2 protein [Gaiellaceae bacterium]|nr:glycosyltransferase family 2 protein [Gaiellaceae bacterium]